jgi:glycerate 2-kinase
MSLADHLVAHAQQIWQAGLAAVRADQLVREAFADPATGLLAAAVQARRVLVFGAGKAGAAMSLGVEQALAGQQEHLEGLVNVPADALSWQSRLRRIRLQTGRPAGRNLPTAEGVAATQRLLQLVRSAGPEDVGLCLISGGGSALLPAPAPGLSWEEEQQVTALLQACAATIQEINTVRKHLSQVSGGRLAWLFPGKTLFSLILSDVVGDPLDVIASGPTVPDPTTYAEARAILERYGLWRQVPEAVRRHLERGLAGEVPETPKTLPPGVHNLLLGNNVRALTAAQKQAESLGYTVLNLGSYLEGESRAVGVALAGIVRSIRRDGRPISPPACILSGGETTVTLTPDAGRGGRNQELVLAAALALGTTGLSGVVVLSGGTDGEDGPTDAAGAWAEAATFQRAAQLGLDPRAFLARHDSYSFFQAVGGLWKTGLTHTNVTDVQVLLVV